MIEEIIFTICVLLLSIIVHECAHGWTALQLGDSTAKDAGRLTLNPIKHIDPVGTLILPGMLVALRLLGHSLPVIGWAKPVPVNFMRLRHPRRDMMIVAIAGPVVNVLLAIIFSRILLHFNVQLPLKYFDFLRDAVFINLLLAVFNMIPVPPLDGSRIVMGLLPRSLAIPYSRLEPYGIMIVILLSYAKVFELLVIPTVQYLGLLLGVKF
jgi:Zn-dependent protease